MIGLKIMIKIIKKKNLINKVQNKNLLLVKNNQVMVEKKIQFKENNTEL